MQQEEGTHRPAAEGSFPNLILLVEDDPSVRMMLGQLLERAGYYVVTAGDGLEALQLLQRQRLQALPAPILLDLQMPLMNGWGFRRRLLADPVLAQSPS